MKREVLFRGWSIQHNQWFEGLLRFSQTDNAWAIEFWEENLKYVYEVHPDSVGQFTGLLDCNGVKIFEGMLIETPKGTAPVTFELGCFYVITVSRYRLGGWATDSIKITGNTFKPQ